MRKINVDEIEIQIEKLLIEANYILPEDIKKKIDEACSNEQGDLIKKIFSILRENFTISEKMEYPLCQDTGMAVIFLKIGQDIEFTGGHLIDAVNKGVEKAYRNGFLRKSVVSDPLRRKNTCNNLPAIIHTEIINGDRLHIDVIPKGFGAENQSALKMLTPSAGRDGVVDFIVEGVIASGSKGCPPCVIGVGIGGDFEYCALLAKKALLIPVDRPNPDPYYEEMENEILDRINQSGIGCQGLGGSNTCLSVKILSYPTHIAGLPVAYNYSCHATRHKSVII